MQLLEDCDIHIHPGSRFVLIPTETVLHQLPAGKGCVIIQSDLIILFLRGRICSVRIWPEADALLDQAATAFLQFSKAPVVCFRDLLGHLQAALEITVLHGLLFLEGGVTVPDIVG